MLIAFLENNLNEDGSVRIPEPCACTWEAKTKSHEID
jgi:hypothetical protein